MLGTSDSRRPYAVAATTLLLIPVLLVTPGIPDTLANRFGIIFGLLPLAMFLFIAASSKPWEFTSFLTGFILIGVGIFFFASGDILNIVAQKLHESKKIDANELREITGGMSLWLYSIPLVNAGIGINIISSYLSTEKPTSMRDNNKEDKTCE